jgi:hypothetical protein
MSSNLPEWEQLLNAFIVGVSAAATYFGLTRWSEWRKRSK